MNYLMITFKCIDYILDWEVVAYIIIYIAIFYSIFSIVSEYFVNKGICL